MTARWRTSATSTAATPRSTTRLLMSRVGTVMRDPNRWQPLALEEQIAQNGLPIPGSVQNIHRPALGSRHVVRAAALRGRDPHRSRPAAAARRPVDRRGVQGGRGRRAPPQQRARPVRRRRDRHLPGRHRQQLAGHQRRSRLRRQPGDRRALRAEPGAARRLRPRARRVLGRRPESETPPGHWNMLANDVTDTPGFERRIGGTGEVVDPLEWDVKMYLALNGAVHDAAIAAWGVKGYYDSARPISMVRYMGGLGQSSDPAGPSYDPDGPAARVGSHRGRHRGVERAGRAPRGARRRTSARSPSARGAASRRTRDRDERRRLDPRRRLGALSAVDVRHARRSPATSRATARSAEQLPR